MEKSWKEAIKKVLSESSTPLHYAEISEQVLSRGYYETDGATPAATVNAQISSSIKHDGDKSPFIRVGKGIFNLKNSAAASVALPTPTANQKKLGALAESDVELSDSIIHSFGMYWQRDLVVWRNEPKMFGKQQALSKPAANGVRPFLLPSSLLLARRKRMKAWQEARPDPKGSCYRPCLMSARSVAPH